MNKKASFKWKIAGLITAIAFLVLYLIFISDIGAVVKKTIAKLMAQLVVP